MSAYLYKSDCVVFYDDSYLKNNLFHQFTLGKYSKKKI